MDETRDLPFMAIGNDEPLPPGLPEELTTFLRRQRAGHGWCDHGLRLSACWTCKESE